MKNVVLAGHHAQRGGAIWVDDGSETRIVGCTLQDNTCTNAGGAVCICGVRWGRPATVRVDGSTFTNNRVDLTGGAIFSYGHLFMTNSTIHANEAIGANWGNLWVRGGITAGKLSGSLELINCTITDNLGGGLGRRGQYVVSDTGELIELDFYKPAKLANCIVYGNTKQGKAVDIAPAYRQTAEEIAEVEHCLFGTATGIIDVGNNLRGIDPKLGTLADNGGGTQTRALLPDSPAIDAGSRDHTSDKIEFDQRGTRFRRIVDGDDDDERQIDLGAIELQQASS